MAEDQQAQTEPEDDMPQVSSEIEGEPTSQAEMEAQLPAMTGDLPAEFTANMPVGLQIFFNTALYNRCRSMAILMSRPEGVCPSHLKNKPAACFAVVNIALTARMSPFWVALGTYQTPSGSLGFHGDLIQAIMEQSGEFSGAFKKEYVGEWSKVQGKFAMKQGNKGEYAVQAWDKKDEEGLGIRISNTLKETGEEIVFELELKQAATRFSTLWATDPKTQLGYLAIRRFAKSQRPSALMGLPVLGEQDRVEAPMREINPEDRASARQRQQTTNGAGETTVEEAEKKDLTKAPGMAGQRARELEAEKKKTADTAAENKPTLDQQIDAAKKIEAEAGGRPKFTYQGQSMVAGSIAKHALNAIEQCKELSDLAEIDGPLSKLCDALTKGQRDDVAARIKDAVDAKLAKLRGPAAGGETTEDFGFED